MSELLHKAAPEAVVLEKYNVEHKLALIADLLFAMHGQNILYCHWKSNEHLAASMTADTDLDILFCQQQKTQLELLLSELGFKKFCSIKQKQYKDIEDFIGLDPQTGKVVHVHAHFRLTMGEMYLKGYQLELEEQILSTRIYDEKFGIYCTTPAFELILLYFREALKIRNRDVIQMYLRNRIHYAGNVLSEYKWLKSKVTDEQIKLILISLFKDYQPIYELMIGEFDRKELLKLSVILKRQFSQLRLYSPPQAFLLRHYREAIVRISRKLSQYVNYPVAAQRTNPRGGIVVAVIGADGSGKSTVTANLQQTFKSKLDVYRIYFGRGDGKKSWALQILNLTKTILKPSKYKQQQRVHSTVSIDRKRGFTASIFKCIEALLVASEKRRNLKKMLTARKKGMLVICDRFPQNQVLGYNDGPLLHYLSMSGNPILRAIARYEARTYALAEQTPPDILFKLIADAKIVEARKPGETLLETLEAKIEGIQSLQFSNTCKVVTIDASQPLDTVLATVKNEIWNTYN